MRLRRREKRQLQIENQTLRERVLYLEAVLGDAESQYKSVQRLLEEERMRSALLNRIIVEHGLMEESDEA